MYASECPGSQLPAFYFLLPGLALYSIFLLGLMNFPARKRGENGVPFGSAIAAASFRLFF